MDPAVEACIKRAQDPTLIPGIYNYCDSRCGRCAFTARCLSFRETQEQRRQHGDHDLATDLKANADLMAQLMRAWCEREGIDFDGIENEAVSEAAGSDDACANRAVERDPLSAAAHRYRQMAYAVTDPLRTLSPLHEWPANAADAIDTIAWNASLVSSKIHRALHGFHERHLFDEDDEVQNDWNGSAKVARLAIAQSLAAWDALFAIGETPPGAQIREAASALARLDADVAQRFPDAMAFVRPGFDEPDVAAGALTSLAPFEPRRQRPGRRWPRWLPRLRRWTRRARRVPAGG